MRFQGGRVVKKKRKLFPGLPPASPDSVALPPTPTTRFGNIDPIPFRCTARIAHLTQDCPISQDRLTRVQLLFTRNLSPLRSSKFSFEYLLLPPRSAPEAVSPGLAPEAAPRPPRPPTHRGLTHSPTMAGCRSRASAPSIFGANRFGRGVVTHSLADFDFHDHRGPATLRTIAKAPGSIKKGMEFATRRNCTFHASEEATRVQLHILPQMEILRMRSVPGTAPSSLLLAVSGLTVGHLKNMSLEKSLSAATQEEPAKKVDEILWDERGKRFKTPDGKAYLQYVMKPINHYSTTKQLDHEDEKQVMLMQHTYVPSIFRGQGVAAHLCVAAFQHCKDKGHLVLPICSYISDTFLPRNPQWEDLVLKDSNTKSGL